MSAVIDIARISEPSANGKEVLRGITPDADANPLFGILTNWHWMTVKYADVRGYKNVHWASGKRAAVTMFASAAWQAAGIAIEDYRVKRTEVGAGASSAGRYDLYFRLKETDYLCGAKRIGLPLNEPVAKGMGRIDAGLSAACAAAQGLELQPPEKALGVLFVTLEYRRRNSWSEQYLPAIRGAVTRWHEYLRNLAMQHCDAAAWFFPLHAIESLQDAKMFYPGCAVFVKECGPAIG